jgi:hypothetical protein
MPMIDPEVERIERRDNLIALINTWNEATSPSTPRTSEDHEVPGGRRRGIRRNDMENTSQIIEQAEAIWTGRRKFAVRALLNGCAEVGQSLANSWHPAGEVEGIEEDTELDGTAGFEISDPSEIPAAVRLAKWFFGSAATEFALISGDSLGSAWMPEDSGVLVRNARVEAVFNA